MKINIYLFIYFIFRCHFHHFCDRMLLQYMQNIWNAKEMLIILTEKNTKKR